jgi:hypothetical protein
MNRNHPMCSWRAGCGGSRTSGSEGDGKETTGRKTGPAPRRRPYLRETGSRTHETPAVRPLGHLTLDLRDARNHGNGRAARSGSSVEFVRP